MSHGVCPMHIIRLSQMQGVLYPIGTFSEKLNILPTMCEGESVGRLPTRPAGRFLGMDFAEVVSRTAGRSGTGASTVASRDQKPQSVRACRLRRTPGDRYCPAKGMRLLIICMKAWTSLLFRLFCNYRQSLVYFIRQSRPPKRRRSTFLH